MSCSLAVASAPCRAQVSHHRLPRRLVVQAQHTEQQYVSPSSRTGATELRALERFSTVRIAPCRASYLDRCRLAAPADDPEQLLAVWGSTRLSISSGHRRSQNGASIPRSLHPSIPACPGAHAP